MEHRVEHEIRRDRQQLAQSRLDEMEQACVSIEVRSRQTIGDGVELPIEGLEEGDVREAFAAYIRCLAMRQPVETWVIAVRCFWMTLDVSRHERPIISVGGIGAPLLKSVIEIMQSRRHRTAAGLGQVPVEGHVVERAEIHRQTRVTWVSRHCGLGGPQALVSTFATTMVFPVRDQSPIIKSSKIGIVVPVKREIQVLWRAVKGIEDVDIGARRPVARTPT